jgi:hypothetical protein
VKSLPSGKFKYTKSDINGQFRIIYKEQLHDREKEYSRALRNMESSQGYPCLPISVEF